MLQGWMPQSFVFRKKSEGEGGLLFLQWPWGRLEMVLSQVLLCGV